MGAGYVYTEFINNNLSLSLSVSLYVSLSVSLSLPLSVSLAASLFLSLVAYHLMLRSGPLVTPTPAQTSSIGAMRELNRRQRSFDDSDFMPLGAHVH